MATETEGPSNCQTWQAVQLQTRLRNGEDVIVDGALGRTSSDAAASPGVDDVVGPLEPGAEASVEWRTLP